MKRLDALADLWDSVAASRPKARLSQASVRDAHRRTYDTEGLTYQAIAAGVLEDCAAALRAALAATEKTEKTDREGGIMSRIDVQVIADVCTVTLPRELAAYVRTVLEVADEWRQALPTSECPEGYPDRAAVARELAALLPEED